MTARAAVGVRSRDAGSVRTHRDRLNIESSQGPLNFFWRRPVATFQIDSELPVNASRDTNHELSGLKASARTVSHWGRIAQVSPVAASHSRTVLSQLPEAIHCPSGLYATG